MPFFVSRRTLAALTAATLIAVASPGIAGAAPLGHPGETRGFVQQLFDGAAAWAESFLAPLWQREGNGFDPHGNPSGRTYNRGDHRGLHGAWEEEGNGFDPHGDPRPTGDAGWGLDPEG